MTKYMILEILQTQAFDVIIAVSCIIPFYFLMKMYVKREVKKIHETQTDIIKILTEIWED